MSVGQREGRQRPHRCEGAETVVRVHHRPEDDVPSPRFPDPTASTALANCPAKGRRRRVDSGAIVQAGGGKLCDRSAGRVGLDDVQVAVVIDVDELEIDGLGRRAPAPIGAGGEKGIAALIQHDEVRWRRPPNEWLK